MVKRYYGGLITSRKIVANATIASGIYNKNIHIQAVKAGAWPAVTATVAAYVTDPIFSYNSLLLNANTSANPFNADISANNFEVTVVGDAKAANFNPYMSGYYSAYFDGSGDYLTAPSSSAFTFGTGDFTIEGWAYVTAHNGAGANGIFQQGTSSFPVSTTNTVAFGTFSSGQVWQIYAKNTNSFSSVTWNFNTWYHFAVVRSSGTTTLYIDGVAVITVTSDTTNYTGTYFGIGSIYGTGYSQLGYISNVRVVNGTAVYTSAFTPPTEPLTAITNTSLLTCQSNRFIDNSTNAFAVTKNGDTTVVAATPFSVPTTYASYGGGYFDGSGDYLSIPNNTATNLGTGDFTIEFWMYANATQVGSNPRLLSTDVWNTSAGYDVSIESSLVQFRSGGGTGKTCTFAASDYAQWVHLAFTRAGTTFRVFKNGVVANTYTDSSNLTSANPTYIAKYAATTGSDFTGYISDIRIIKGTALYTSAFTPPASPLSAVSGTSLLTLQNSQPHNNHTFLDKSNFKSLVNRFGNASQGTFTPYGANWSNYFDGSGDYLTAASNAAFGFGTGDFTIEFWAYSTVNARQDWVDVSDGTNRVLVYYSGSAVTAYTVPPTSAAVTGGALVLNQWNHYAVSKSGGNLRLFVNGTQVGSTYTTNQNYGTAAAVTIGKDSVASTYVTGYISNLRIVKGTGLYTGNFTVPTTPLTAVSGTSLLTCQSNRFIDNSTNAFTITKNGDTKVRRFSPFSPTAFYTPETYGGGGYFDGSGDYISLPNSASHAYLPKDFTVECWFYLNTVSGTQTIISHRTSNSGTGGYVPFLIWMENAVLTLYVSSNNSSWNVVSAQNIGTLIAGQWYHLAYTRTGSTVRVFVNGVQTYTFSSSSGFSTSNALQVGMTGPSETGAPLNGYVSDVRITNGTGVYTGNFTPPSAPLGYGGNTAIYASTANVNTTFSAANTVVKIDFTDAAFKDYTMNGVFETVNDTKISTTQSKFGGTSMYFDGTDDHIQAANIQPLGSGDFTFEMWIYPLDTNSRHVFSFGASWSPADGISMIQYGGNFALSCGTGWAPANAGQAIEINGWHHIALVRNSTAVKFYYDGVMKGSGTDSTNLTATGIDIGYVFSGGAWGSFYGYIDDLRITKGYARYTGNFTPPTSAFPLR